jgi:hypothetical protein
MAILLGILSLGCGYLSFGAGNPPVIPVLGIAFGAAGLLRENRGDKRKGVVILCWVALALSVVGTVMLFARR